MKLPGKKLSLLAAIGVLGMGSLAAFLFIAGTAGAAGGINPEQIPSGYNFPTPKTTIDGWVANNNVSAMRGHAWDIWGGLTAQSSISGLPIWETWYSPTEIFQNGPLLKGAQRSRPSRPFISPNQFHHQATLKAASAKPAVGDTAAQLVAFNKFNGPSGLFIRSSHQTPPSSAASYRYNKQADLIRLNASWPAATQPINRTIVEFPNTAVDLKPVFWLIKAKNLTAFPFWQGPSKSTNRLNPTPGTWLNCMLVDPDNRSDKPRPVEPSDLTKINNLNGLACTNYVNVVPLSMFYSFTMNAAEAAAFNNVQGSANAQAGDHATLAAMHVTTKESKNWTWQTFWWQAGQNPPGNFPGSVEGMSSKVKGPWRNYAMCTAYSTTVKNDPTGLAVLCFNPFLETSPFIPDGIRSNCMSCHGRAAIGADGITPSYPATYSPNGWFNPNDPTIFGKVTQTDFAWAVANNSN